MFINPTGLAGRVAEPAVASVDDEKLIMFKKNCCHARVGRLEAPSKNSLCG
jgi:hypothetical protein